MEKITTCLNSVGMYLYSVVVVICTLISQFMHKICIFYNFVAGGNLSSTWHLHRKMRSNYDHRPAVNEVNAAMAEMDRVLVAGKLC